jgi:hypothetical protein
MANEDIRSTRERERGKDEGGRMKDERANEMNQQAQGSEEKQPASDSANNEVGPTEKLREHDKSDQELSVPGAQNPASEEVKDEQGPNTE